MRPHLLKPVWLVLMSSSPFARAELVFPATGQSLGDKQLGIATWLADLAENASLGIWPAAYLTNRTGNVDSQLDMTSIRYSAGFSAYALAALGLLRTPAYRESTTASLAALTKLLTDEKVWRYWVRREYLRPGTDGDCADGAP